MKWNVILYLIALALPGVSFPETPPRVLCVVAHPDDETVFAATLYKITHALKGTVDVVMVTNGEGGYKYATFANPYYGLELTDEACGRKYLPGIRKKEAVAGGRILGVRRYNFLDQQDLRYTLDPKEPLESGIWDTAAIRKKIAGLIEQENYAFLFTMLPKEGTHGHHKAAAILALEAVRSLPPDRRPIILAANVSSKEGLPAEEFVELKGYPITRMHSPLPFARFDKTTPVGHQGKLDYKIIVNWLIAEHKSQGTMQLYMNRGDFEDFYFFSLNDPQSLQKATHLFDSLAPVIRH